MTNHFYNRTPSKRANGLATFAYIWANLPDEFFTHQIANIALDNRQCLSHRPNCSNYAKWMASYGLVSVIDRRHDQTNLGKKALVYRKVEDPEYLSPELQWLAKSADSREELYMMLGWLDND